MPTIPWEQVRDIVDAVLDRPAAERAVFLDAACSESSVRRYVESLVLSYEQAGEILEVPAMARYARTVAEGLPDSEGRQTLKDSVPASTWTESFNWEHSSCCKTGFAANWVGIAFCNTKLTRSGLYVQVESHHCNSASHCCFRPVSTMPEPC